ncbi:MAG TPA: zf-HC2 domain-containing protein [Gemmatimonadota bacterium]|nr:zf-HC2 domain-containing protein [Gemmatimonadota bacterium]
MSKTEMQACPEFLERFSEFIDGTLGVRRQAEILAHLDCCEGCLRHLRAYRNGVSAYRSLETGPFEVDRPYEGPDDFYSRLEERLRRGDSWGYLEPVPLGTFRRPDQWASVSAAGVALAAVFAFVIFVSGVTRGGPGPSGARPPVSIAGVIPTVLSAGVLAKEEVPEAGRAEVASRAVSQIAASGSAPARATRTAADAADRLPVVSLEAEFARFQARYLQSAYLQNATWGGPRGDWPVPNLVEAALRLP